MTQFLCKMCVYAKHSKHFVRQNKDTLPTKQGTCDSCGKEKTVYDVDAA